MSELENLERALNAIDDLYEQGVLRPVEYYKQAVSLAAAFAKADDIDMAISIVSSIPPEYFLVQQVSQMEEDENYFKDCKYLVRMIDLSGFFDEEVVVKEQRFKN